LWSRGFTLHGKDRKEIGKIFEYARADTFFPALEAVMFEQGHSIITIRKTLGGELRISAPLLWGTSNVAKVYDEEVLVVTWERIVFDDANFVIKSVYDAEKTITTFHYGTVLARH